MSEPQWQRVKQLFHAALEQPAATRAAFVNDACTDDDATRAAVQRLLQAHEQAGSFIEVSPVAGIVQAMTPSSSIRVGAAIAQYEIRDLVGTGGMGEVYAAHDTKLDRRVALKVVSGNSDDAYAALRREARHASKLNHPHICTIHDVGTYDDRPFIVMEYVEGRSLKALIEEGPLAPDAVLRYGTQIADALAHAHAHGVVHRDLKSANVVVTPDGRAKVLDFGLARRTAKTAVGVMVPPESAAAAPFAGTLAYMAPELLRGAGADERSDIWALGVVLYELATGRLPFSSGNAFEQSSAILTATFDPLPPHLPGGLSAVIGRCLAKDPAARYADAQQVRAALEAVGKGGAHPVAGRRVHAWVATLTIVGLLTALAVFGVVSRRPSPGAAVESTPPVIAVADFDNVGQNDTAWLTKGVPSMLLTTLTQAPGLRLVSTQRLYETARQLDDGALNALDAGRRAEVARRAGAGAVVTGTIMKSGSEIRIDARLEDVTTGRVLLAESVQGTDVFPLVDRLAARIRDRIGLGLAMPIAVADMSTTSLEAYQLFSNGEQARMNFRLDDAREAFVQAVAIDPSFAQAYLQLAYVSELQNRPAEKIEAIRKASEHLDRLGERERLVVEVERYRDAGALSQAAATHDRLVATYPDSSAWYPTGLYEPLRGAIYDPDKQLRIFADAVRIVPTAGGLRNFYGYALMAKGRHAEAIEQFETYARLAVREPNPYDSRAEAYLLMGLPDKAIQFYSQALTIDPTFTGSHTGRGWAYATRGRYEEAVAEHGLMVAPQAFVLARTGRYRDAAAMIESGIRQADTNQDPAGRGELELLTSWLAIERRQYQRAADSARSAAQRFVPRDERTRVHLVLADTLEGIAHARAGRMMQARMSLDALTRRYRPDVIAERWWQRALHGEILLAEGTLPEAADYPEGGPAEPMFSSIARAQAAFVLTNNHPVRDLRARILAARGDFAAAIGEYRRLTGPRTGQQAVAALEPLHVFETARLLQRTGDTAAARQEYTRFLELWKHADAGLPELAEARRAVAR